MFVWPPKLLHDGLVSVSFQMCGKCKEGSNIRFCRRLHRRLSILFAQAIFFFPGGIVNHARLKSGRKNKKTSSFLLLLRSVSAFSLSLSLFNLLGSASPVCPSCASLTFDTHRFNNHQTFAERHKQPWPRLSPTGGPDATAPTVCE